MREGSAGHVGLVGGVHCGSRASTTSSTAEGRGGEVGPVRRKNRRRWPEPWKRAVRGRVPPASKGRGPTVMSRPAYGRSLRLRAACGPGWLALAQVPLEFLPELLELGRARGEQGLAGLRVNGHEIQPVPRGRVQRGLDGRVPRAVDRTGRQALMPVGVVRRRAVELLVIGEDAERVQTV